MLRFPLYLRRALLAALTLACTVWLAGCSLPDLKRESPAPGSAEQTRGEASPDRPGATIARREPSIEAGMAGLASQADTPPLTDEEVGYYMDVLMANLRMRLPGEASFPSREGNDLRLLLPGHMTFSSGSASLSPAARALLERVAAVLAEYQRTQVVVEGHSDARGPRAYNQTLSEQRALAVARYLGARGVAAERLVAVGYGPSRPLAGNDSEAGRRENRRVELLVRPVVAP